MSYIADHSSGQAGAFGTVTAKHFRSCLFLLLLLVFGAFEALGQERMRASEWGAKPLKESISDLKSGKTIERTLAAKTLVDNWAQSVTPIIGELKTLDSTAANPQLSDDDLKALIALTDVLRTILANNSDSAVKEIRKVDNDPKAIQALAWSARSENRELRINSTYVLANIVDNTSVCIILDHLRDPKLSPNGRVNLLQVVLPVAGYAYQDNIELIQKTLSVVETNARTTSDKTDLTNSFIKQINARLLNSTNAGRRMSLRQICPERLLAPLN